MCIKDISGKFFPLILSLVLPSVLFAQTKDSVKTGAVHPTAPATDTSKKKNPAEDTTILRKNSDLGEVVVVAYGAQKKEAITGAVVQISAKDLSKRSLLSVADALAGSAPGIQATLSDGQPGSSPNLRLRGFGSISASSSPLLVVDGVVYDGDLASLNVDDIASVTPLLDASSSALYGSRGSNGVILITTKKGSKSGKKPAVKLRISQGYNERMIPEYKRVDAYGYYPLMWELYRNGLITTQGGYLANQLAKDSIKSMLGYNPFNVPDNQIVDINGKLNPQAKLLYGNDLDWENQSTRKGFHQDYGLSFNGGNDFADYFASVGYVDDKGYTPTADFKRWTARVNANAHLSSRITAGLNVYGSTQTTNQTPAYGSGYVVNPFYFSRTIGPIYPVHKHDATGAYVLDNSGNRIYDDGVNATGDRPFAIGRNVIEEGNLNENYLTGNSLGARANVNAILGKGLTFTSNLGIDQEGSNSYNYLNPLIGDGAPAGSLTTGRADITSYSFNQLFNYNKSFGLHSIDAMVGHENYQMETTSTSETVSGLIFPEKSLELSNYTTAGAPVSSTAVHRVESYLSRINYNYNARYFVTLSARRDGNSSFPADNRWANFWSAGGAWLISKEDFFNVPFVNDLKAKLSYGKVGNDAVGTYPYQGGYVTNNNAQEPGYIFGQYDNHNLTWESLNNLNTGVEFSLLKRRLSGYIQYYNKASSGLVFAVPQPLSAGGTPGGTYSVWQNVGDMYNRGVELSLTGVLIARKDLNWQVTLNASTLKNRITQMPADEQAIVSGTKRLAPGHSIYDYWLPVYKGVDAATGDALYALDPSLTYNEGPYFDYPDKTINGKQYTTVIGRAKYDYVGSAIPKVYGSVRNNVEYKRLSFGFICSYQIGGLTYDAVYAGLMSPQFGYAAAADLKNSWHNVGDQTNIPRLDYGRSGDLYASSSRWLTSATSLTINNVNFGYTFDPKLIKRTGLKVGDVQATLTLENVYQFSGRTGMNVLQSFNGVTSDGFIPRRAVTMGVVVNM
jgi:TonB-linked SusC/RagA family outer membrane protein